MIKFLSIYAYNLNEKKILFLGLSYSLNTSIYFSCTSEDISNDININGRSVYAGGLFY